MIKLLFEIVGYIVLLLVAITALSIMFSVIIDIIKVLIGS